MKCCLVLLSFEWSHFGICMNSDTSQYNSFSLKDFNHGTKVKTNLQSLIYCWFSVSRHSKQIKLKIKTFQQIVQNLGNERRYINKDPRQDSGQRNISYTRYPKKCFTQTFRDLYGDAMLLLTWMSSNMAHGNQQKHLLPSFATRT